MFAGLRVGSRGLPTQYFPPGIARISSLPWGRVLRAAAAQPWDAQSSEVSTATRQGSTLANVFRARRSAALSITPYQQFRPHGTSRSSPCASAATADTSLDTRFLAASHNIMDGRFFTELLPHYMHMRSLSEQQSQPCKSCVGFFCVQENVELQGMVTCAHRIAETLGDHYQVAALDGDPRLATIYDSDMFQLTQLQLVPLPRLERLGLIDRSFIKSGVVEQRHALICDLSLSNSSIAGAAAEGDSRPIRVINFHLDAAGNNQHRAKQFHHLESYACPQKTGPGEDQNPRFVLCGDTNIFHFHTPTQQQHLQAMLAPFDDILSTISSQVSKLPPTHFFARANEPTLAHQLVRMAGLIGLDIPQCYDIVVSSEEVVSRGQIATEHSDHDLVFAELRLR